MIFRVPIDSDQVIRTAKCSFRVDTTYGCTGCSEPAFIVMSAFDIETTGLLPFTSNCSFFLKDVACTPTPQRIPVIGSPESCEIFVKGSNQTLSFPIDYKFRGQVFAMGISTFTSTPSVSERLSMTLSNPNFLTSLQISMGAGIFIAVLSTILKSTSRYAAYKMAKSEVNAV